jgi:hypothetical protein
MQRFNFSVQAILILLLLALPALVQAQGKAVGKVISIIGSVEVQSGVASPVAKGKEGEARKVSFGPWSKVKPKQAVYASDKFRTARKSRVKILFEDKSLMALGPNTTMTVESYLYKPEDKLRQGVINVTHGLSMYIVNKGQKNPKSSFKMVTPTGNIAARGTKGFLSVSEFQTLVANQAGDVLTSNKDPKVVGDILVGAMMQTIIEMGKPPTDPIPLTESEVNQIQNVVMAWLQSKFTKQKGKGKIMAQLEDGDFGDEEDFEEFYDLFDDILGESCTVTSVN